MTQREEAAVRISVRRMVEFILRSGDIDAAYLGANRALEGTRIHQKIQKQRKKEAGTHGAEYKTEVYLSISHTHEGVRFEVEGRADGIWREQDTIITVDEIKSTLRPVAQLDVEPSHVHWAQAKCYGHMLLKTKAISGDTIPGLNISLIYCHVETEEQRVFTEFFTQEELENFFTDLMARYHAYARMEMDCRTERNVTVRALNFPYGAYRPGQREMAVAVFASVKQKRKLFVQAPTGIGKTISVLFPAVKALAEGHGEKIFYLTAKTVVRKTAEEAVRHMAEQGLRMRVVTITARDKICFLEKRACNPETCPYARGHFDRVNAAILDCVLNELIITRSLTEDYAKKHNVCPAEYQLDLALFCDIIICDYNHVYDPKAKLQRFFQFGGDNILLNDEAHNLIDRARDMFSAELYKRDFTALRRELGRRHPLYAGMGKIANEINKVWKNQDEPKNDDRPGEPFCMETHPLTLLPLLLDFAEECDAYFRAVPDNPFIEQLLSLYFNTLDYLRTAEVFDERFAFYCEPAAGCIRLYCLDPSYLLAQEQKKSRTSVFFSATLTPLNYFRALLGGGPDDYTLRLASPFPRANLCLLVDDRISTRYKHRADTYETVAERLYGMVSAQKGNYMVFFSSYAYLSAVYDIFANTYPTLRTRVQAQDMPEEERETFLAEFTENPEKSQLAFAVLGGVFSEGIDLKGSRLIGAAVVGVGLPLVSAERDVIMRYYNRYDDTGFAFAYRYPGMNKVMQAAGRVIRTETDRGVVLLIDSRFTESDYRTLFPPEWTGYKRVRDTEQLTETLREFWQS